jgi:hypothetical protein
MAEYKVDGIAEAKLAEDAASVQVTLAAGHEQLALTMDRRIAGELIERLAAVRSGMSHPITAADTRARRLMTACHRVGIGVAILLLLPVLWGLWLGIDGMLDRDGWLLVGALALAPPLVYGAVWLLGWIVAGFLGTREQAPPR